MTNAHDHFTLDSELTETAGWDEDLVTGADDVADADD